MRRVTLVAATLFLLVAAPQSQSSTVLPMTTEDMAAVATVIVDGTISTTLARLDSYSSGHQSVNTHAKITVIDRLKGLDKAVKEITIVNPGGQVGTKTTLFPGAPTLRPGTRGLFFLWKNHFGEYRIVGLSQGMKLVKTDGDAALIIPSLGSEKPGEGEAMQGLGTDFADQGQLAGGGIPLKQFKNLVKAYLAAFEGVEVNDPLTGEPIKPNVNPLLKPWLEEE